MQPSTLNSSLTFSSHFCSTFWSSAPSYSGRPPFRAQIFFLIY
jgi:hypothetical protein